MNKSNLTHTFHGGEVPILRSAIEGDRLDYRAMLAREYALEFCDRPAQLVEHELKHGRLFREIYENTRAYDTGARS